MPRRGAARPSPICCRYSTDCTTAGPACASAVLVAPQLATLPSLGSLAKLLAVQRDPCEQRSRSGPKWEPVVRLGGPAPPRQYRGSPHAGRPNQLLVVVPSRELALQIGTVVEQLWPWHGTRRVCILSGSVSAEAQYAQLQTAVTQYGQSVLARSSPCGHPPLQKPTHWRRATLRVRRKSRLGAGEERQWRSAALTKVADPVARWARLVLGSCEQAADPVCRLPSRRHRSLSRRPSRCSRWCVTWGAPTSCTRAARSARVAQSSPSLPRACRRVASAPNLAAHLAAHLATTSWSLPTTCLVTYPRAAHACGRRLCSMRRTCCF